MSAGASDNMFVNVFAFMLNVMSSVLIIFVNKQLMQKADKGGAGFSFSVTLCAFHYICCSLYMWVLQAMGSVKRVDVPFRDLLIFTLAADVSIASLNVSLMVNNVGFYQIAKLLVIPFVCCVEYACFNRRFTPPVVAAVAVVAVGVGIVTVSGPTSARDIFGTIIAGASVVGSGMQQILCRSVQQKNSLSSQEMLLRVAPLQGVSLLLVGPAIDYYITKGKWITDYVWTPAAAFWMLLSCSVAILVNISQFMVLGRFTAVTYQVLGHSKTIIVLFGGWLVFHEYITTHQAAGMVMAVLGMVWYGRETSIKKTPTKEAKIVDIKPLAVSKQTA